MMPPTIRVILLQPLHLGGVTHAAGTVVRVGQDVADQLLHQRRAVVAPAWPRLFSRLT
jgi:hypothetical protein